MTPEKILEHFRSMLSNFKKDKLGYSADCPCCNASGGHFKLDLKEGKLLLNCLKCDNKFGDFCKAVNLPNDEPENKTTVIEERLHIYRNPDGTEAYRKIGKKFSNGKKQFWFNHFKNGITINKKPDICNNLYNLDDLEKADEGQTLYIVEGEKCADKLKEKGFLVTTGNTGGTGLRLSETDQRLLNKFEDQVIIPDLDEAGSKYVDKFPDAKVLDLRDIWADVREKQDIYDFISLGHDVELIKNYKFYEIKEIEDLTGEDFINPEFIKVYLKLEI